MKNLTHGIDEMSVAEIRKSLAAIRRDWSRHSPIHPVYTCTVLAHNMSMAEFCFRFVMGHHAKRHHKAR